MDLDDLLLELDVTQLIRKMDELEKHIKKTVPGDILYVEGSNPNPRCRYGAILIHVRSLRSILRTFMEK